MSLRYALALVFAAALPGSLALAQGSAPEGTARPAVEHRHVVELFTSQGCSSCPPADALLTSLADRADLVALTLAVDYWDYLGWKDTLGSAKHSKRQREYAKVRGDGMVYTPQMVIDGRIHVNGAKINDIDKALGKTSAAVKASSVSVELTADRGKLLIEAGNAQNGASVRECTLYLVSVQRHVDVPIRSGENKGRTLAYTNVVRDITPLGAWSGKAITVKLNARALSQEGADGYVAILQEGMAGPVVGASKLVAVLSEKTDAGVVANSDQQK